MPLIEQILLFNYKIIRYGTPMSHQFILPPFFFSSSSFDMSFSMTSSRGNSTAHSVRMPCNQIHQGGIVRETTPPTWRDHGGATLENSSACIGDWAAKLGNRAKPKCQISSADPQLEGKERKKTFSSGIGFPCHFLIAFFDRTHFWTWKHALIKYTYLEVRKSSIITDACSASLHWS